MNLLIAYMYMQQFIISFFLENKQEISLLKR